MANHKNISNLKRKIVDHDITVSVIGLGYVGLPLLMRFCEEGFKSIGLDIDKSKIDQLNKGKSYIKGISGNKILDQINNKLQVSNNYNFIKKADVIIICVPTPLSNHNEPDLSFIKSTLSSIKPYLKKIK